MYPNLELDQPEKEGVCDVLVFLLREEMLEKGYGCDLFAHQYPRGMFSDELLDLRVGLDLKNNADKLVIKLVLPHKIPVHQVLLLL